MGRLGNYLRLYRRRWQLTQAELAFLFGYADQSIIAKLEHEERTITVAVAYASGLLFGLEPREIFPALFESIEGGLLDRAHHLHDRLLQAEPTQQTLAKLELLHDGLTRLTVLSERKV
jgi:transcriptional regulator with XRE-family HTH domain